MGEGIRIATLPRQPIRPRVSLRAASCQPQSCCLRSSRRHVSAISPRDRRRLPYPAPGGGWGGKPPAAPRGGGRRIGCRPPWLPIRTPLPPSAARLCPQPRGFPRPPPPPPPAPAAPPRGPPPPLGT